MTVIPKVQVDRAAFTTPAHADWKAHAEVVRRARFANSCLRDCIGLALIVLHERVGESVNVGPARFVPDEGLRWASIVDVPGETVSPSRNEVQWATVRPTTTRYGTPALARGDDQANVWNFCQFPYDRYETTDETGHRRVLRPSWRTLNPATKPQLFRVFNAINWAMTSYAVTTRRVWGKGRAACYKAMGVPADVEAAYKYGDGVFDKLVPSDEWMPVPYIGFDARHRDDLFDLSCHGLVYQNDVEREYNRMSVPLRAAFCDAVADGLAWRPTFAGRVDGIRQTTYAGARAIEVTVSGNQGESAVEFFSLEGVRGSRVKGATFEEGEPLAVETTRTPVPRQWHSMTLADKWQDVKRMFGPRLDVVLRTWFRRQAVFLTPDLVHYPVRLSGGAALAYAVDGSLYWDLAPAAAYYDDACDAMVFPPIPTKNWGDLRGTLAKVVPYDLGPWDREFVAKFG